MKYQYLAPLEHERHNGHRKHRILTPDGGVIMCVTEADALRVVEDMNALCLALYEHDPNPQEDKSVSMLIDAWCQP